jgi:3-oxoadipate enol-lactonase
MAERRSIRVDQGELAVVTFGPVGGPPVLLIPGGPGEARAWRYTFPELEGAKVGDHGLRVATFDRRGVGGSSSLDPCTSSAEIADDAVAVGKEVLGDRFHVAGISVGGMAALQAAIRHPDAVVSLTLIATTAGGSGHTPPDDAYIANVLSPPDDPDAAIRENLALALSPGWPDEHPERFESLVHDIADSPPVSDEANAALLQVFISHDVAAELAQIAARTLVIGCDHDRVVPPANAEHLAAHIPSARLARVPTGHAIDVEAPDQLIDLLIGHIVS